MIRALLRLLSLIALAVAVIMAVLDATRSIAADALTLTPLATSLSSLSPELVASMRQAVVGSLPAFFWDPVMTGLLRQPGFAVLAVLALLLALAGRPRRRGREGLALQR